MSDSLLDKNKTKVFNLLKKPDTFRVWLLSQGIYKDEIVGNRGNAAQCPIAIFLNQPCYNLLSKVHLDAIVMYYSFERNIITGWVDTLLLGYWVRQFIEGVDNLLLDEITSSTALEVLDNITDYT